MLPSQAFYRFETSTIVRTLGCLIVLYYDQASQKESVSIQPLQELRHSHRLSGFA